MSKNDELGNISMEDFQDVAMSSEDLDFLTEITKDGDEESLEETNDSSLTENNIDDDVEHQESVVDDESSLSIIQEDEEDEESPIDDDDVLKTNLKFFTSALVEGGVLSSSDTQPESVEEMIELVRNQIRSNEFSDLNDEQKAYLKALEKGLSHEEVVAANQARASYETITAEDLEENENLRRQLIIDDFLAKGFSKEKAEKLASRSFETLSDSEDALEALNNRKEAIKLEIERQAQEREKLLKKQEDEYKQRIETIKKTVFDETKEIIPGVKLNSQLSKTIFENITKPVKFDEAGRPISKLMEARAKDPNDFDVKLNVVFELTKGFTDFSKFTTTAKTNAVKEFEDKLKSSSFIKGQSSQSFRFDDESFNKQLDFLEKQIKK